MKLSRETILDCYDQVNSLVDKHDIDVGIVKLAEDAYCYVEEKEIHVPKIHTDEDYATVLHEIGHILGPYQSASWLRPGRDYGEALVLMSEYGAWKWAYQNAIFWNDNMNRIVKECLFEYYEANLGDFQDLNPMFYCVMDEGFPVK